MISDSLIVEISILRLRQRRMLQLLRDKGLLDWDGEIQADDPDLKTIYDEIHSRWLEDQEKLGSSRQIDRSADIVG